MGKDLNINLQRCGCSMMRLYLQKSDGVKTGEGLLTS